MASRFPVNKIFSVTVKVSQEGLYLRALAPMIPGFRIVGPAAAVRADIEPVLTAMVSQTMLRPVTVTLMQEVPSDTAGRFLLIYNVELENCQT